MLKPFLSFIGNPLGLSHIQIQDMRFFWLSGLCNSIGMMGGQVVLGWVILEITESPLMVGIAMGIRFAPNFFLGILAGTIADMFDRRRLMQIVNLINALANGAIGILIFLDIVEIWHILTLTFLSGSMMTLYMTARSGFTYDISGPEKLVKGLAFTNIGMRMGGLIGSLVLGVILGKFGADIAYFVMVLSYVLSTLTLIPIHFAGRTGLTKKGTVWANLRDLGIEVRRNSELRILAVLVAVVEVLGFSYMALLPVLAKDVLNIGAEGLGVLFAFMSGGGMLGIVVLSFFKDIRRKGLLWLLVLLGFACALIGLGLATNLYFAILFIILVSSMTGLSDIFSQSLMQFAVPDEFRGRAMGVWNFAIGVMPAGNIQAGALASVFGVTLALVSHGTLLGITAIVSLLVLPKLRKL